MRWQLLSLPLPHIYAYKVVTYCLIYYASSRTSNIINIRVYNIIWIWRLIYGAMYRHVEARWSIYMNLHKMWPSHFCYFCHPSCASRQMPSVSLPLYTRLFGFSSILSRRLFFSLLSVHVPSARDDLYINLRNPSNKCFRISTLFSYSTVDIYFHNSKMCISWEREAEWWLNSHFYPFLVQSFTTSKW